RAPPGSRRRGHARPLPLLRRHRVEAGELVAGVDLDERRDLLARKVDFVATARLEGARARRPEHVSGRALDRLELRAPGRVEPWHALEQAERVGMARPREQLLCRPGL